MECHRNNWLDIFSGFRIAFSCKKILIAATGLCVTILVFGGLLLLCTLWRPSIAEQIAFFTNEPAESVGELLRTACAAIIQPEALPPWQVGATFAGVIVIVMAIWAFFGGAICRLAAIEFATNESHPVGQGLGFAARRFGSFFWAPLVPYITTIILLLCASLVGALGRIPGAGLLLMGVLSFVAVFLSCIALLVLLCGVFGSIFMWPTIAVEGTNAFDAVSRAFNYLLARPWKTLWCCLISLVHGVCCIAFVGVFVWAMLKLAMCTIAFGMGAEAFQPIAEVANFSNTLGEAPWDVIVVGLALRTLFLITWLLVWALAASYKFSSMTLTYFILRRDVDGARMDEVYLPEPEAETEPSQATLESSENAAAGKDDVKQA